MNRSDDLSEDLAKERWREALIHNLTAMQRRVVQWQHSPEAGPREIEEIVRKIAHTPVERAGVLALWERLTWECGYTITPPENAT